MIELQHMKHRCPKCGTDMLHKLVPWCWECRACMLTVPTPELSAEERAEVDRFDRAPDAGLLDELDRARDYSWEPNA